MNKHPDCEERCQSLVHHGYQCRSECDSLMTDDKQGAQKTVPEYHLNETEQRALKRALINSSTIVDAPAAQLEPCPFCGSSASMKYDEEIDAHFIECSMPCGAAPVIHQLSKDATIAAWNRRTRSVPRELAEAEAALLDVVEYGRTPGILEKHSAAITRARKGER